MEPETLYLRLSHLASTQPDFTSDAWNTPDGRKWLGRFVALVEIAGEPFDHISIKTSSQFLGGPTHNRQAQTIISLLHNLLAKAELEAPESVQGSFLPVGESFTALAAISKILRGATKSALMIDPYADADLLTEFAVLAPEGVLIKVLAGDTTRKPGLIVAAERWPEQYNSARPLQVRLAPAKKLHDRLIILDSCHVWILGQSFSKLAARSPTSIIRIDPELAKMKFDAYDDIWEAATQL